MRRIPWQKLLSMNRPSAYARMVAQGAMNVANSMVRSGSSYGSRPTTLVELPVSAAISA